MRRVFVVTGALLVGVGSLAACGDDEAAAPITQEEYEAEAERLCDQHGGVLAEAYSESQPDSDAEEAAFYLSDVIPRGRALVRRLADFGFPPDNAPAYTTALNEALAVLAELEAEPYRYIDQRHARTLPPEEDLMNRLQAALADADVPC